MSNKLFQRGVIVEDTPMDAILLEDVVVSPLCDETIVIDSKGLTIHQVAAAVRQVLTDDMLFTSDGQFPLKKEDVIGLLTLLGPELEAHGVRVCVNTASDDLPATVMSTFPTVVAYLKPTHHETMQEGIRVCAPFKCPPKL